jgi:hypothetical protein
MAGYCRERNLGIRAEQISISGGRQPSLNFELQLSETAASRPLQALVGRFFILRA